MLSVRFLSRKWVHYMTMIDLLLLKDILSGSVKADNLNLRKDKVDTFESKYLSRIDFDTLHRLCILAIRKQLHNFYAECRKYEIDSSLIDEVLHLNIHDKSKADDRDSAFYVVSTLLCTDMKSLWGDSVSSSIVDMVFDELIGRCENNNRNRLLKRIIIDKSIMKAVEHLGLEALNAKVYLRELDGIFSLILVDLGLILRNRKNQVWMMKKSFTEDKYSKRIEECAENISSLFRNSLRLLNSNEFTLTDEDVDLGNEQDYLASNCSTVFVLYNTFGNLAIETRNLTNGAYMDIFDTMYKYLLCEIALIEESRDSAFSKYITRKYVDLVDTEDNEEYNRKLYEYIKKFKESKSIDTIYNKVEQLKSYENSLKKEMGRLASYDSSESGGSEGKGSKEDNSFNEKQKHIKGIQGLINYNTNQINKCIMDIKMKLSEIMLS